MEEKRKMMVPVFDPQNNPLMPTSTKRARSLLNKKQAFSFWKKGIFCIKLFREPKSRKFQDILISIDPGTKREGYTVSTDKQVIINILTNTPYWIKDKIIQRKQARSRRRYRKCPNRKRKLFASRNTKQGYIYPSIKARWNAKLRIINFLSKLFPIKIIRIEDIKNISKPGKSKLNKNLSNLKIGKNYFYNEIKKKYILNINSGFSTYEYRKWAGYTKNYKKLDDKWDCHNVDSHVMCEIEFNKNIEPCFKILKINFFEFRRRQLHVFQPSKNGKRRNNGSTISRGFKRGSLVIHSKLGLCFIGGNTIDRGISLHEIRNGQRIFKDAKVKDIKFLTYSSWRAFII